MSEPDRIERYRIEVGSKAAKYISKLDKPTRERIKQAFDELSKDPINHSGEVVNSDPPARSCRVGGYRMIIYIDNKDHVVLISKAGPRGQIYDRV